MEFPYSKKFMEDKDFVSLLEMCGACAVEAESDGLEMLMANLAKIHEYSGEMMALMSQDMEIEDWIEDKISKAAQSLSDAKHYIEYRRSAYASQAHAIEMHGGDVHMGQRMSVSGAPEGMRPERLEGDRMPVMSQVPEMTPQSSMGMAGVSVSGADYESTENEEPEMEEPEEPEMEEPVDGPEEEEPEEIETEEPTDDDDEEEMSVVSLSEMFGH